MEIVDAQVHLNMLDLERAVAAMDAIGVDAVLIDEYRAPNPSRIPPTGFHLADGSFRYTWPYAEAAVDRYPERFAYLGRYEPDDPGLIDELAAFRSRPGALALRICPLPAPPTGPVSKEHRNATEQLREGVYDRMLALAERHGIPIFLHASNGEDAAPSLDIVARVARDHPELTIIADHTGVGLPSAPGVRVEALAAQLDAVSSLARFPNVALKWCHAPRLSAQEYPWRDVGAMLRRMVDAFGADRVMWASDWTVDGAWGTWAEALFAIRDDPGLSPTELEWLLGRTTRTILRWPAAAGSHR